MMEVQNISSPKKIIIAGGSGFIGQYLSNELQKYHFEVIIVSRKKHTKQQNQTYTFITYEEIQEYLIGDYIIINLAGDNISKGKWTDKKKQAILNSRVSSTQLIFNAVNDSIQKPELIIQGSAIGFYDNKSGNLCDENAAKGKGFLSEVVNQWEQTAIHLKPEGVRLCIIRTGVVFAKDNGAFPKLILPVKLYAGGKIGNGNQWISWIHIKDMIDGILFLINRQTSQGIYNFTAPNPVQNKDFIKIVAKVLHRPVWLPVPAFIIKLFMGEKGETIALNGENAYPKKLLEEGFKFSFPDLENSLKNLLK